ncbi:glycine cleavage system H protein [Paenibacillus sp. CCS19]|uniref:glycine cleavage system protein GcvH n=1 Tax=Paenibacillus sp. CCS19 TaxID=3158387 RepID=UPI00255E27D8|nr:glycine cleavage system protein GcvH [Paenibacillus cellulosilyticus]GMK40004.1 glycine cleavage system H protein [Paenibacillus cellulosilyticus]
MSDIRQELRYTEEHEWAVLSKNGVIRVGITDYAQCLLGDIVYVELPSVGTTTTALQPMGTIESVKTVSDLFSPLDGVIVRVNEQLQTAPELVNEKPYEDGWLVEIEAAGDASDALQRLLTAEQYEKLLSSSS